MEYHVGQAVNDYLKKNKIRQVRLSEALNYDAGNLNRALRKKSMNLDMIIEISLALKTNFLEDISKKLNAELSKNSKQLNKK